MAFHEVRFPPELSALAVGGPAPEINVIAAGSGDEQRNRRHNIPLWQFSIDTMGLHALDEADEFAMVRDFILAVGFGRENGFRFKFHGDYRVAGAQIGVGDGVATQFQLVKIYAFGGIAFTKPIKKPVAGTLVAYEDGVAIPGYTVDTTTGLVTAPAPPAGALVVTADFEFDFPVRFDQDYNPAQIRDAAVGTYAAIGFQELRV